MKNAVSWDVASYRSCVNRCFGGTYRLHLQGRARNQQSAATCSRWFLACGFSTLKMEAIRSSETQDLHGATSQKTAFFIVTAVKTSNLTKKAVCFVIVQSYIQVIARVWMTGKY
jgi:hypothetical protein